MRAVIAATALGALLATTAIAAPAPSGGGGAPDTEAMYQHLKKARELAGADLYAHYNWRCITDGVYPTMGAAIKSSKITYEPLKVFDNLYFLGQRDVSAWALKTSAGIVLIDTLNSPEDAQKTIVAGLQKLGLDPKDIKFVVITHSHGDHFGGANYIKQTYGARLIASKEDWAEMEAQKNARPREGGGPARWAQLVPARDIEVIDGQVMKIGDTPITFYLTPGHTPGTLSMIFPTTDLGKPHTVAMFGGLGTPRTAANMRTLIASEDRFAGIARQAKVDAFIANHEEQEQSMAKMEEMKLRHPGDPNPYVIGTEAFVRFLGVQHECTLYRMARAGIL